MQAIRGLLANGQQLTIAELIAQLQPGTFAHPEHTGVYLLKRWRKGELLRQKEGREFRYWLNPDWVKPRPGRRCGTRTAKRREKITPAAPKAQQEDCPPLAVAAPVNDAPVVTLAVNPPPASIGLVCGAPPQNPAQGRIEDALAAVLDPHEPRALNQVLALLPAGWGMAEAVSAVADGVIDAWIGTSDAMYWLASMPPAPRVDPLVEQFKAMRLRARLEDIDRGLCELLEEPGKFSSEIGAALINARTNTRFALKHITV